MRVVWGLATVLFVLALPVTLLTSNVRWLANDLSFYQRGYESQSSYQSTGLPKQVLDQATVELIAYFNSSDDLPRVNVTAGGRTFSIFNERDSLHLRDVKDLFQLTYGVQEISLAYVLLFSIAMMWRRKRTLLSRLAWPWVMGGVFTVCLLAVIGLAMLLDFDRIFLQFHLVSFSNDFWMLDPADSYLIRMVPEGFFMELAFWVAGLSLVQGAVLAILAWGIIRLQQKKLLARNDGAPLAVS